MLKNAFDGVLGKIKKPLLFSKNKTIYRFLLHYISRDK